MRYLGSRGVHLITQNQINKVSSRYPTRNMPTFLQQPSASQLAAAAGDPRGSDDTSNNCYAPYGFDNNITAYLPRGNSTYNGLASR